MGINKSITETMDEARSRFKEAYGRLLTEEEAIELTDQIRLEIKKQEEHTPAKWDNIKNLRKIDDHVISGLMYPYDYAKKHKNMKDKYCESYPEHDVGIVEHITLKKDHDEILYCIQEKRKEYPASETYFESKYGIFKAVNHGEFGGELQMPSGEKINGNFSVENMFELGDKVIAISSCSHMAMGHTEIYVISENHYEQIYDCGSWYDMINPDKSVEEYFYLAATYMKNNVLYALLSGHIRKKGENWKPSWNEIRLLEINASGEIKEVIRLTGACSNHINSILIADGKLYITEDKMLVVVNITQEDRSIFDACEYYTWISEEDEKQLRKF